MGQTDRRCDHHYPPEHEKAGDRCGSKILPAGSDLCKVHTDPSALARDREDARLRRLSDREMRKPPPVFYEEEWDTEPFRPAKDCAAHFDVDLSTATRWYAWIRDENAQTKRRDEWENPAPATWWELNETHIPGLVADFGDFRAKYFRTPRREPFMTPDFQQRWVASILKALVTGGRQVILSPPRCGKSEMLIHTCTWLICLWPDIRIIWVGGNERIAQRSVGAVAAHLSQNRELIEAYVGPGGSFRPRSKDGLPWSKSEFTVATRQGLQKGRTMTALGRGGTLLSLDADILVADDIEDHGSTAQPGAREATREWWTSQLESRKEEHTALFVIGSRQHPDDLCGRLLENEAYEQTVETAHDRACQIPDEPDRYDDHQSCMLFPELRSYAHLMSQKKASETTGGTGIFAMVYLNESSERGLQTFTREIVDPCRDPSYVVGQIPPLEEGSSGVRLVAGLDPAGSGYQAAFLWAYQIQLKLRMWMVDLENREGGGIAAARETIREWTETYPGLAHWVVEENLYQGGIVDDDQIRAFANQHGIVLEGFRTYRNKVDPHLGVTSLQPLFADKSIVLPYGDAPSQAKTDTYRAQLLYYDGAAPRNRNTRAGYKSDLVMASWFPLDVIRRAQQEVISEMAVDYEPEYEWFSAYDWNEVPWETQIV